MKHDAVPPTATSTWAALWSGTGRVARRGTMPLAWAITLGVCAVSAFAVRDVVFPSLEPSASPSLWQPQPGDSTSSVAGVIPTADRIDESTALPTTELVVPTSATSVESSVASLEPVATTAGRRPTGGSSSPTQTSAKPRSTTTSAAPSSNAPTTSIDDDHSTSTSTGGATTTSGPDPSTTVTETTDPPTTDTLPGDTLGGSSGSGRGGRIDDSHP